MTRGNRKGNNDAFSGKLILNFPSSSSLISFLSKCSNLYDRMILSFSFSLRLKQTRCVVREIKRDVISPEFTRVWGIYQVRKDWSKQVLKANRNYGKLLPLSGCNMWICELVCAISRNYRHDFSFRDKNITELRQAVFIQDLSSTDCVVWRSICNKIHVI